MILRLQRYGHRKREWLDKLSDSDRWRVMEWDATELAEKKARGRELHASSSRSKNRLPVGVCRHWVRSGRSSCLYGDSCKYLHPPVQHSPAIEHSTDISCRSSRDNQARVRSGSSNNTNRAGAFRRFLLDVFGRDRLDKGSGIIEVAGGIKGGVAFELVNLNNVACTVIEPRGPMKLERQRRILLKGIYHRTGPFQSYNTTSLKDIHARAAATGISGRAPRHWRMFFESWMLPPLQEDGVNDYDTHRRALLLEQSVERAATQCGQSLLAGGHEEGCCCCSSVGDDIDENDERMEQTPSTASTGDLSNDLDTEQQSPPYLKEMDDVLLNASCLIGMHPDYPTGDIVSLALALNKPFAVVPCCVFLKAFPDRRLPCGTEVRTYEQFLDWIRAKDPLIRTATLPFGGRAIVLYYDPEWKHAQQHQDRGQ